MKILSLYLSYEEQRKILYQGKSTVSSYTAKRMYSKLSKKYYDESEKERVIDVLIKNRFSTWKGGEFLFLEDNRTNDISLVREFLSSNLLTLISLAISLSILLVAIVSGELNDFTYIVAYIVYGFTRSEAAIMIVVPMVYFLMFYLIRVFINGLYKLMIFFREKS